MPPLLSAHNFYVSPSEIVYALEKLGNKVQWPTKMKSDPATRKSNVLCEFHQERKHRTEDCIGLHQEVVRMLNQGFLKELLSDKGKLNFARGREQPQGPPSPPSPTPTINMIIGDGNDSAINHVKFTTTHKLKQTIAHERYDDFEDSITFDKSNTNGLSFPHYDALVITLRIADTDVKRIMIDDGSGAFERTSREITLPVLAEGVIMETTFHVMNQETTYNAIIGRPLIHAMRAVPSSFYQVIKFPTPRECSASGENHAPPRMLQNSPRSYVHQETRRRKCESIAISPVEDQGPPDRGRNQRA
uniref:Retrotransposon gag domain-containing protein n=1 Tax=Nicotiana tabacum TaxID=4097 RepID=A0A1S4DR27_TOBAC|nr:PREDICTED: uncharacterized protein LOC107832534 [Nicotiana tabacum]